MKKRITLSDVKRGIVDMKTSYIKSHVIDAIEDYYKNVLKQDFTIDDSPELDFMLSRSISVAIHELDS